MWLANDILVNVSTSGSICILKAKWQDLKVEMLKKVPLLPLTSVDAAVLSSSASSLAIVGEAS